MSLGPARKLANRVSAGAYRRLATNLIGFYPRGDDQRARNETAQ